MKKKYLLVFAIATLACSVIGGSASADVWEGINARCTAAGGVTDEDQTGEDNNGVPYYTVTCTLGDNANKSALNDCTFSADGKVCTWTNVQKSSEIHGGGNSGGSSSSVDRRTASSACMEMGGGSLPSNSNVCHGVSSNAPSICHSSGGYWDGSAMTCRWNIKYDDDYYTGVKVCKVTEDGPTVAASRCAHKIYEANGQNAAKTACKNKDYELVISKYIAYTTTELKKEAKVYAEAVCGILLSENVDPCNYENSTAREECTKSNKKYYWDDPDATINPSSKESSTNSNSTVESGECTSILPSSWCGKDGIGNIVRLVKDILTGLVVVAGTIGIIICGVMWMTARDNEAQVATAKRRIFEIVIGLVAWILLSALANLLIPSSSNISKVDNSTEQVKIVG